MRSGFFLKAKVLKMKNDILKLITVIKQKEENALANKEFYSEDGDTPYQHGVATGAAKAYSSCIQLLTLLLENNT